MTLIACGRPPGGQSERFRALVCIDQPIAALLERLGHLNVLAVGRFLVKKAPEFPLILLIRCMLESANHVIIITLAPVGVTLEHFGCWRRQSGIVFFFVVVVRETMTNGCRLISIWIQVCNFFHSIRALAFVCSPVRPSVWQAACCLLPAAKAADQRRRQTAGQGAEASKGTHGTGALQKPLARRSDES